MRRERNTLLDRVERELRPEPDAFRRLEVRRDRRGLSRRVAGGILGVALTIGMVVVAVSLGSTDDRSAPRPGGSVTPPPVPLVAKEGEYYYVRIRNGSTTNERWYSPDGSGRFTTRVDGVVLDDRSFSVGELTGKMYSELSVEPSVLIGQLAERSDPGGASPIAVATPAPTSDREVVVLLAMDDLLGFASDYLVPAQTGAIYKAASAMPMVAVDAGVDPAGRRAVSLSWSYRERDSEVLVRWFFEPSTLQFMGEQRFDSATGGAEVSATTIIAAGIASSVEEPPTSVALYVPRPRGDVASVE